MKCRNEHLSHQRGKKPGPAASTGTSTMLTKYLFYYGLFIEVFKVLKYLC